LFGYPQSIFQKPFQVVLHDVERFEPGALRFFLTAQREVDRTRKINLAARAGNNGHMSV
jgi:hypothetical protein